MNHDLSLGSLHTFSQKEPSWNGSVSIFQPLINAFKSVIKVDIEEAITTAQNTVGENATTIAAYIHPESQYIVYNVFILDSSGVAHKVLVDPENDNVLDNKQVSLMEVMNLVHDKCDMMGHDNMMGPEMGMMGHDNMYDSWN